MELTPCDGTATSETWCCGATTDCCDAGQGSPGPITIARRFGETVMSNPHTPTPITPYRSASSDSSSSSSTSSTTPSARPNKKEPKSGLSTGAVAGIGVGAAAGSLAFAALVFLLLRSRRKAKSKVNEPYHYEGNGQYQLYHTDAKSQIPGYAPTGSLEMYRHQAPGEENAVHEMPNNIPKAPEPQEMPT